MPRTESRWYIDGLYGKAALLLDTRFGPRDEMVFVGGKPCIMWPCNESEMNEFFELCCQWDITADFYERHGNGQLELKVSLPLVRFPAPARLELVRDMPEEDSEQLMLLAG